MLQDCIVRGDLAGVKCGKRPIRIRGQWFPQTLQYLQRHPQSDKLAEKIAGRKIKSYVGIIGKIWKDQIQLWIRNQHHRADQSDYSETLWWNNVPRKRSYCPLRSKTISGTISRWKY